MAVRFDCAVRCVPGPFDPSAGHSTRRKRRKKNYRSTPKKTLHMFLRREDASIRPKENRIGRGKPIGRRQNKSLRNLFGGVFFSTPWFVARKNSSRGKLLDNSIFNPPVPISKLSLFRICTAILHIKCFFLGASSPYLLFSHA